MEKIVPRQHKRIGRLGDSFHGIEPTYKWAKKQQAPKSGDPILLRCFAKGCTDVATIYMKLKSKLDTTHQTFDSDVVISASNFYDHVSTCEHAKKIVAASARLLQLSPKDCAANAVVALAQGL